MVAAFLTVHFVRWKTKRKEPLAVQVILSRPVNGIPVMGVFEPPNAKDLPVLELDGGSAADPSISCQQNLQAWVVPISSESETNMAPFIPFRVILVIE